MVHKPRAGFRVCICQESDPAYALSLANRDPVKPLNQACDPVITVCYVSGICWLFPRLSLRLSNLKGRVTCGGIG
jgi:hypothetical protein